MPSIDQWKTTWSGLGVSITESLLKDFEEIISRYSEPHRKYHTTRHLDECLAKLPDVSAFCEHPAEVELALWFHDVIYDTRSHDNEARSAELATAKLQSAGGLTETIERVAALILATRHDALPQNKDAQVVVDVDLSILGANIERFDEYEKQIREEYFWVPELLYRHERKKIMMEFLSRASIFSTQLFRDRYEQQARGNIKRSIHNLSNSIF